MIPDRPPVQAGARLSEYVAGGYAALGALTALRARPPTTVARSRWMLSVLESLLSSLPYPMLMAEKMRRLGLPANTKAGAMMASFAPPTDGSGSTASQVSTGCDVCAMLGLPEYGEHQIAIMLGGPERAGFFEKAQPWLSERTVTEIVELSQAMRIPAAPVNDGESVLTCPQYRDRGFFVDADYVTAGRSGGPDPRSACRRRPRCRLRPAPRLGEHRRYRLKREADSARRLARRAPMPAHAVRGRDGISTSRTFWAGAYLTCYLGAFGADVVKVESIQRPDGMRYPERAWAHEERLGGMSAAQCGRAPTSTSATSHWISRPTRRRGTWSSRLMSAMPTSSVENFSPRVIEQSRHWTTTSLVELKPDVILVRMPGFGLRGPVARLRRLGIQFRADIGDVGRHGLRRGPAVQPAGARRPIVGVHAGVALLAALEHRRRTGEGQLIEIAQIEVAASVAAEPVVEYSMNGVVRPREGNRRRGRLQGVYPTAVDGAWVAISVRDDLDWTRLVEAMSRTDLQQGLAHDAFDQAVARWTRTMAPSELVDILSAQDIPAEQVLTADRMYDIAQLDERGFYQTLEHPITGEHRYPGWPFCISPGPVAHHRSAPPTLGQHNEEVLRNLGLSDEVISDLRARRVIGETALNG